MKRFFATAMSLLFLVAWAAPQSPAPAPNDVAGTWSGRISAGNTSADVLLHVTRAADGSLHATLDSLGQNEFDIPAEPVTFTAPVFHFAIERGAGIFDGKLAADGSKVVGTWTQGGEQFPLALSRISDEEARKLAPPPVRVAFVISDGFDMIDLAGPWEVFQDVMDYPNGQMRMLMTMYTVSATRSPVRSSGGATFVPQYTFDDAPPADIVVVPAQSDGSAPVLDWLRKQNAAHKTIMSVCTGAAKLAATGLLDGHPATSHHEAIASFKTSFPKVAWQTSLRWVRSTDNIYTAAGLTSGIDLALHLVEERYGRKVAQDTADYMEYHGADWKQPQAVAAQEGGK